jgi:hypothetical protein
MSAKAQVLHHEIAEQSRIKAPYRFDWQTRPALMTIDEPEDSALKWVHALER